MVISLTQWANHTIARLPVKQPWRIRVNGSHESAKTWWRRQMKTFSALLAICAGNSPVAGEFPAQRPVTRSFDVCSSICAWINAWVNNREAGDLRRYRAHYDFIVMNEENNHNKTVYTLYKRWMLLYIHAMRRGLSSHGIYLYHITRRVKKNKH